MLSAASVFVYFKAIGLRSKEVQTSGTFIRFLAVGREFTVMNRGMEKGGMGHLKKSHGNNYVGHQFLMIDTKINVGAPRTTITSHREGPAEEPKKGEGGRARDRGRGGSFGPTPLRVYSGGNKNIIRTRNVYSEQDRIQRSITT